MLVALKEIVARFEGRVPRNGDAPMMPDAVVTCWHFSIEPAKAPAHPCRCTGSRGAPGPGVPASVTEAMGGGSGMVDR